MSGEGDKEARGVVPTASEERHIERHFDIRKGILLGFFNGREQYDVSIDPGQGTLMFNGRDIYWLIDNEQRMSDTVNNAIQIWLSDGSIEEAAPPSGAAIAVGSDGPSGRKHEE